MASTSSSPTQRLREALPALQSSVLLLAESILSDPEGASRASVTKLAQVSGVAPSTVSRLAARLGYDGFPDLRAALATEHGRALQGGWAKDIGSELSIGDPPERLRDVLAAQQHRAAEAAGSLDLAVAEQIADAVAGGGRVVLHGGWADAVPLEELRLRLLRLGIAVWLHADATAAGVAAATLGEGDVLLALSRSGADTHAAHLLERARRTGARTALITGDPSSPLAAAADMTLSTGVRSTTWTETFAGRASDTLACSLIWLLVAQRVPEDLGRFPDLMTEQEPTP
ncbi:MurR/RpiR family transcriptional regulator [Pseudactinotalea sp.]|uniref:MurR/RpiR family transcriptional regulator n=1 Tax=Pseudactinotalea sp. TaxID=1926260 RepID=UPI003B3A50C3